MTNYFFEKEWIIKSPRDMIRFVEHYDIDIMDMGDEDFSSIDLIMCYLDIKMALEIAAKTGDNYDFIVCPGDEDCICEFIEFSL
jgi:hypothetical protein